MMVELLFLFPVSPISLWAFWGQGQRCHSPPSMWASSMEQTLHMHSLNWIEMALITLRYNHLFMFLALPANLLWAGTKSCCYHTPVPSIELGTQKSMRNKWMKKVNKLIKRRTNMKAGWTNDHIKEFQITFLKQPINSCYFHCLK